MNEATQALVDALQELTVHNRDVRSLTDDFSAGPRSPEDLATYVDDLRSLAFPLAVIVKEKGYEGAIDFDLIAEQFITKGVEELYLADPASLPPRNPKTGRFARRQPASTELQPKPLKEPPHHDQAIRAGVPSSSGSKTIPFDEFLSRLYSLMWKGQSLKAVEYSAWGAQCKALLEHSIGYIHPFTSQYNLAIIPAHRLGIAEPYAVLQALREDAELGHLRLESGHPYRSAGNAG